VLSACYIALSSASTLGILTVYACRYTALLLLLLLLLLCVMSVDETPSIDAVIVGGFYGTGFAGYARSGMFTSFLMAIRSGSKEDADTDEECMVYTCGKVGSGIETAELQVCL
jgi:hypothetical protein